MRAIFTIFLAVLSFQSIGQEKNKEKPKISKSVSKLKKAKGWISEPRTGKVLENKNKISWIDEFRSFSFHTITYNGDTFLYLKKLKENIAHKYPNVNIDPKSIENRTDYVMDLEDYKQVVQQLSDSGTITVRLKFFDNQTSSADIVNLTPVTQPEPAISDLKIRYRIDRLAQRARFIIFVQTEYLNYSDLVAVEGLRDGAINSKGWYALYYDKEANFDDIIINQNVFERFYYECDVEDFENFIKGPLKL